MSEFVDAVIVHAGDTAATAAREVACKRIAALKAQRGSVQVGDGERWDSQVSVVVDDRWVVVHGVGGDAAGALSRDLGTHAFHVRLDDELLEVRAYRDGTLIDHYVSDPALLGTVPKEARKRVTGTPARWSRLLVKPHTPRALERLWRGDRAPLDKLLAMADVLGIPRSALDESSDPATFLRFRAPAPRARTRTIIEGPPRFTEDSRACDWLTAHAVEKSPGVTRVTETWWNIGGGARGVELVFAGEALDRGLLGVEKVELRGDLVAVPERRRAGATSTLVATFPDEPIPPASLDEGATSGPFAAAPNRITMVAFITVRRLKNGSGAFEIRCAPIGAPEGACRATRTIDVKNVR